MKEITLKKTGTKKTCLYTQRMVYAQPIRKLFDLFKEKESGKCSLSTFIKYKPFYITSPTEREKESCLCKRFLNMHLLLDGVNNFRKTNYRFILLPQHLYKTVKFYALVSLTQQHMIN